MSTPTDMMIQMLMAQITDLQRRVTGLEAAAAGKALSVSATPFAPATSGFVPQGMRTGPVASAPSSHPGGPRNIVKHSVPLQNGAHPSDSYQRKEGVRGKPRIGTVTSTVAGTTDATRPPRGPRITASGGAGGAGSAEGHSAPPVALSAILRDGEQVTMSIGTGKNEEGNFTNTTCTATFKDEQFTVTASELAPELVDKTFKAPGEVLYKFMDQLKQNGHIKRTFSVAPWKLCTVERDGKTVTLQDLRNSA